MNTVASVVLTILCIAAVVLQPQWSAGADDKDVQGVFVSDDGLASLAFFKGEETGATPPEPGKPPVKVYKAFLESSLFNPGEYRYDRTGRILNVKPLLAEGESPDAVKKLVFRFSIVDENTLYEDETGVTYRRQE